MIGCIIQARTGSTRLPGKVLLKLDKNNTVLDYVIKQLRFSKLFEKIIIATTSLSEDDQIINNVQNLNVDIFRGSSSDVLDRFFQCAKKFSIDVIIRITADNPLIDPTIVDDMIKKFMSNSYDYLTNAHVRTFPYGTEVEIFSFNALEKAWKNAKKPSEREHVTPYLYNNLDNFKIFNVEYSKNISNLRWTIDRNADLKLIRLIISKIKNRPILLDDILVLYSKEPQLFELNKTDIPNEGFLKSLKEDEEFKNQSRND